MDVVGTLLIVAAATGSVLLLAQALRLPRFLIRCYKAKLVFQASPIPGPPLPKSILGHVFKLAGPGAPWVLLNWANTFGPLYKLQFMDRFTVVITDPDTIASATHKTGPVLYLPKPTELYKVLEVSYSPRAPNLVSADDTMPQSYWKAVRQATAPCFSYSNLKQVVPLVVELTGRVVQRLEQQEVCDATNIAKRITSDVMGQLLYGEDLKGTRWEPNEYLEVFYPMLKAQAALFVNPFHLWQLWSPEVRKQRRCLARHNELMAQKVSRLRSHPPEPHTIAAHILAAVDPATGQPLDDVQVKAEVATFMAAGFETTSHAITWCLTMLAAYPDVQDQVVEELQAAGLTGRDFKASDLGRLPLLSAVIKETLRLCAPAPFGSTRHVANKDGAELCGFHVPKGTLVMMTLMPLGLAIHNYGPSALEFKPQRWLAAAAAPAAAAPAAPEEADTSAMADTPPPAGSDETASPAEAAVAPPPDPITFMTGPRDCIGQNLAKLELQVVLSTLLSRFKFSPGPELEKELQVAAATGQPASKAVQALAGAFVTLQPLAGHMHLRIAARAEPEPQESSTGPE